MPLIGHHGCNKYISVFAPGTLGILPDTDLVPVSHGSGDIISIYGAMGVYQCNIEEPLD